MERWDTYSIVQINENLIPLLRILKQSKESQIYSEI